LFSSAFGSGYPFPVPSAFFFLAQKIREAPSPHSLAFFVFSTCCLHTLVFCGEHTMEVLSKELSSLRIHGPWIFFFFTLGPNPLRMHVSFPRGVHTSRSTVSFCYPVFFFPFFCCFSCFVRRPSKEDPFFECYSVPISFRVNSLLYHQTSSATMGISFVRFRIASPLRPAQPSLFLHFPRSGPRSPSALSNSMRIK